MLSSNICDLLKPGTIIWRPVVFNKTKGPSCPDLGEQMRLGFGNNNFEPFVTDLTKGIVILCKPPRDLYWTHLKVVSVTEGLRQGGKGAILAEHCDPVKDYLEMRLELWKLIQNAKPRTLAAKMESSKLVNFYTKGVRLVSEAVWLNRKFSGYDYEHFVDA